MFLSFPKECLLGCFWNSVKSYVKKEWSNRKKDLLSASSRNLRRKKEEDIDEENLHGTILLLTVNIFARLERMSKPSSDSSSSLLLVYLNELQNIVVLCNYDFFFGGPTPSYMPIDIGLQWIKMYIQCSVGMVQVHSYHDRKGLGLPFMMETYEILTNRTSLYDRKAQTDCRQTYERQILLCPRKVEAKFRHGAEVHTIMQSGIQRK